MTAISETNKTVAKWQNIKLQPGEMVIREFRPGFALWHLVFLILSVVTLGIFLLIWPVAFWANNQTRWAVTNKRLLERSGVFNKRSVVIDKEKITDLEVRRPLLAQLFHNGKIYINTAGSSGKEFVIKGQKDPDGAADDIREALSL